MANANLTIGGDPGGALAAIAAVQGALGGLTGKTIIVNVETKGATGALAAMTKGMGDAGKAHEAYAASAGNASSAIARHAEASQRAAEAAVMSSAAHRQAADDVQRHGNVHRDSAREVDGHAASMRKLNDDTAQTGKTFSAVFGSGSGGGRNPLAAIATQAGSVSTALNGAAKSATGLGGAAKTFGDLGTAADSITGMLKGGAVGGFVGALGNVYDIGKQAAIGMGAFSAVVGGAGVKAAMEVIAQTPALGTASRDAMRAFNDGIQDSSSTALSTALPAFSALKTSMSGLGTEVGKVGAAVLPQLTQTGATLAAQGTTSLKQLEPTFGPLVQAGGALGGAALKAVGDSAPGIKEFADAVTQSAPALGREATSVIGGFAAVGTAAVQTAAALEPFIKAGAWVAGQAADYVAGALGSNTNVSNPTNPDGTPNTNRPIASHLGEVGKDAAIGAIVGSFAGPEGTLIGGAVGAVYGGVATALNPQTDAAKQGGYPLVPTQGVGSLPLTPIQANPDLGQKAAPGQATFTPMTRFPLDQGQAPSNVPTAALGKSGAIPRPSDLPAGAQDPSKSPLRAPQVGGGTSLGAETSQTRALTAAVNDASRGYGQLGASSGTASRAVNANMQSAGQSASQLPQHVGQAAQQIPSQVAQHAAQIPAAVAQPMSQVPKAAAAAIHPAAMVAPVQQAVQHVASQAPAASDAGSDVGSSVGEGMGKGMTKTITNTLTIVENWITKIIKTAAAGLDSHSPSRVFEGFGMSVGQGMELGVQKSTDLAVSATGSMMASVVGAGTGALGTGGVSPSALSVGSLASGSAGNSSLAAGGGLGGQLSSVLGGAGGSLAAASGQLNGHLEQLGQLGQSVAPTLQSTLLGPNGALGTLGKYTDGLHETAGRQSAALRLMSDGNSQITGNPYSSGGTGAGKTQDDKDKEAQWRANRYDQLGKLGYGEATKQHVLDNERNRGVNQKRIETQATNNQALARYQSRYGLNTGVPREAILGMGQTPMSPQGFQEQQRQQQEQQRQQQQAQDQARIHQSPRAVPASQLTGGQQAFQDPFRQIATQVSDLFKSKGQAAAGADGRANGKSYGDGLAGGLKDSHGKVQTAAGEVGDAANDKLKKTAGINSPSTVWAGYGGDLVAGLTGGMGGALSGASSGISGIADNTGLMVGFQWAKGVQDGIQRQYKSADFQSDAVPQLSSQQALTALGIGGQLGASGGGGLVNKNPSVTIGQPVVINLTNVTTLDGQVLDQRTKQITTNSINLAFDQFADSQLRM